MIGKVISHYKIVEKLGEGGMGVVYKAEDTKLERTVALKFLPSEAASSDDDKARFMEEARAAAALDHPNICTVYEINETDGQTYIAMAFVDGRSLKSTLEERPLKINDALKYAVQIAKGLGAAHERGIVHRDIKSANIMITPGGRAKIMDFGLARRGEAYQQVVEESTLGTISYSSPEQVSGAAMDHRTDIWSFGVTLFEMVTGQLPFRGDYEQAIVYSILNEPPEPVTGLRTGVPVELERIISKALAKNPNDRYQHIDDMLLDLKSLQNELDPTMSKTGSRTRTRPIYRQEVSWFRKMLDRHVVQILFVYLAATWGATRLMAWAVDRFVLSPHLTSIVTVAFLSLLPTVVMLGFFRGARAQTDWTKPEKIGIPLNILASLALLIVMFQGKEIGAATTTIAVENEEGQTIERVVPKNEFRKKLALYLFENTSGDTTLNWLQYTIPDLLEADLLQDQFLRLNSAFNESSFRQLKSAGFTDWLEAPVALKRKIARESHLDFFVFGSVRAEGNAYVIESKLYDTRSGKLVADRTHTGADLFSLIDAMSAQIKRDMGVPAGHTESTDDVAVAEMLTNSVEAARHLGLSRKKFAFEKDWEGALEHLESAVNEDPTLAWAHFQMYGLYRGSGQTDKSNAAIELAMQHLYKLPERVQFVVKANYYFAKGDTDKTFAVFKMMTELYPADILGHLGLSEIYGIRNEFEKASAEYKTILELDPYRYDLLHIVGNLSVRLGKYDEALFYYQRYADLNPEDANSYTELGNFFERIGDYEKASANFEKALVIDPNKVAVLIDLGDIERKLGRSEAALQQYENALQKARTAEDRARAYYSMKVFYEMHGQINKAIEYTKLMLEERTPVSAPLTAQLNRLDDVHLYVRAGRSDEAFEILKDVEHRLESPYDKIVSFGYAAVYLELGDADRAQEATEVIEEFIRSYGFEVLRPEVLDCQGRIAEARGDYGQAIVNFERRLELNPSAVTINRDIGRCRRHLKDYQSAEASLQKVLDVYPFDPETNYELAMVYDAMGETSKAAEKLQISLDVWKQADEGYKPAVEARELSERLKSSPPQ